MYQGKFFEEQGISSHTVDRDDGSSSPAGRPLNAFFRAWGTPTGTKTRLGAPNGWPFVGHRQKSIAISRHLSGSASRNSDFSPSSPLNRSARARERVRRGKPRSTGSRSAPPGRA